VVIKRVSSGGHVSGCARNVRVFDYLLLSSGLIRWVVIQWRRKKLRRRRRIPLYRLVFKSSNFERKSASSVPGVGTPRDGSVVKKSEGTKVEEQNKSSFLVEFVAAPFQIAVYRISVCHIFASGRRRRQASTSLKSVPVAPSTQPPYNI
jgi:hypothetical protein